MFLKASFEIHGGGCRELRMRACKELRPKLGEKSAELQSVQQKKIDLKNEVNFYNLISELYEILSGIFLEPGISLANKKGFRASIAFGSS